MQTNSTFKQNMRKSALFDQVMAKRGFYVSGQGLGIEGQGNDAQLIFRSADIDSSGNKKVGAWHVGSVSAADIRQTKDADEIEALVEHVIAGLEKQ